MAIYYVASIAPVDYPAFYDLGDEDLPPTFEEWRVLEDLERRDLVMRGHHVVGLPVEPVVFRRHCRSLNCAADRAALGAWATRVGNDRFGTAATYDAMRARIVVVEDTRAGPVVVEETAARPVVVETVGPRHWWQFWRRPRAVVEEAVAGPVVVDEVSPNRHWWQFWRRARIVARRAPFAARAA